MPTQSTDLDTTWTINTANDTWTLAKAATITTADSSAVIVEDAAEGNDVNIFGDVFRDGGVYSVEIRADDTHVVVGKQARIGTGLVDPGNVGIGFTNAADCSLDNAGVIVGDLTGVFAVAGTKITNSGVIRGENAVVGVEADFSLDNSGTLLGQNFALKLNGANAEVINRAEGVIKSGDVGIEIGDAASGVLTNFGKLVAQTAIVAGDGASQVINRGTIHGDVHLGGGVDKFDGRHGTLDGIVDGGDGSDIYLVGGTGFVISESADSGNDGVRSTITLVLSKNLEALTLLGKKGIDGTGNAGANSLAGNRGDNVLKSLGGSDDLSGGKGDDMLIGGKGADLFAFNHGDGHDTIADFHNGQDVIFTDFVQSENDFEQLVDDHLTVKGSDLLLHGGGDTLLLKNVDLKQLDFSDFFTGP